MSIYTGARQYGSAIRFNPAVSEEAERILLMSPRNTAWKIADLRISCGTYGPHVECDLNTREGQLFARLMERLPKLPFKQISDIDACLADIISSLG